MVINIFEIHGYKAGLIANIHNVTVMSFLIYRFIFPHLKAAGIHIPKKEVLVYKKYPTCGTWMDSLYWGDILKGQQRITLT